MGLRPAKVDENSCVGNVGNLRTDCQSVQPSRARLLTCPAMAFNGALGAAQVLKKSPLPSRD